MGTRWPSHCGPLSIAQKSWTPGTSGQNMIFPGGKWMTMLTQLLLSKLITVIIIMIIMVGYHDHDHHGYHDQCSRVPPVCWRRGKQRHMHWWWRWTALLRKKGADSVPFDIFVSIAWINHSFSCLCSRCQMRTALTPTPWQRTRMTSTPTSLTSEE